jgi:hypothetical protein
MPAPLLPLRMPRQLGAASGPLQRRPRVGAGQLGRGPGEEPREHAGAYAARRIEADPESLRDVVAVHQRLDASHRGKPFRVRHAGRMLGAGLRGSRADGRGEDAAARLGELQNLRRGGARAVTREKTGGPPTLHAVTVDRAGRGPLLVLWDQRDAFHGEDEPPVTVTWPWPAAAAAVTDAFGQARTARSQDGQLRLPVSVTPLFITEEPASQAPGRPMQNMKHPA